MIINSIAIVGIMLHIAWKWHYNWQGLGYKMPLIGITIWQGLVWLDSEHTIGGVSTTALESIICGHLSDDSFNLQVHWHGWKIVSRKGSCNFLSFCSDFPCCHFYFLFIILPEVFMTAFVKHIVLTLEHFWWNSECAVPLWITIQLSGLYCSLEATWPHNGVGSSPWWSFVSWIPGMIID